MSVDLTANEQTSLEKIAALRGFSGRMRAAMRDALALLRSDEPAAYRLRQALEEKAP